MIVMEYTHSGHYCTLQCYMCISLTLCSGSSYLLIWLLLSIVLCWLLWCRHLLSYSLSSVVLLIVLSFNHNLKWHFTVHFLVSFQELLLTGPKRGLPKWLSNLIIFFRNLESFRSPEWNYLIRTVVSDRPRDQQLSIILFNRCIFPRA